MYKKKTKIFLGAYINYTNAQNINCLALARYLNKHKFKVYALSLYNANKYNVEAKVFKCFYPVRISKIIGFIWGILNCDVAYYPKHKSTPKWVLVLTRVLGKKMFTTIEANMCDRSKKRSMIDSFGSQNKLVSHFSYFANIFPITRYILDNANCGVELNNKVLYLGVDIKNFVPILRNHLRNIVFIGSLVTGKGTREFIQLAKIFPEFKFHIIGDGPLRKDLEKISSKNVVFHGLLVNDQLSIILSEMDLHVLLSRCEGFPKVILETGSSGIPSIVYSDYGAQEWMDNYQNGFVVKNFLNVVDTVKKLADDNQLLSNMSKGAYSMSLRFDWKNVINVWEEVINNLYNGK